MMNKEAKKNYVEEMKKNFTSNESVMIAQYQGLNVTELDELRKELLSRKGSVLVFMKTKHGSDRLAKRLKDHKITSEAIHGDLSQNKRNKIIQRFRNNKFNVLIGTDIVSRGLDIPHIEHVINYDLPQVPEDFIHRIGRTSCR